MRRQARLDVGARRARRAERPRAGEDLEDEAPPLLVERPIAGAALRRLDAGGAAVLARARRDEVPRLRQDVLGAREADFGQPDAARPAVVDEDRRRVDLRVQRVRDAAEVPAVADRLQREEADHRVLDRVQRAGGMELLVHQRLEQFVRHLQPEGDRLQLHRRGLERMARDLLLREHPPPPVPFDERRDLDPSPAEARRTDRPLPLPLEDLRFLARVDLRVVVHVGRLERDRARVGVEREGAERLPHVEVDRARMPLEPRARFVERPHRPAVARPLELVLLPRAAQRDVALRPAAEREPALVVVLRAKQPSFVHEAPRAPGAVFPLQEEDVGRAERALAPRGDEVGVGDRVVVRIEHDPLELAGEEVLRMGHDVAVERVGERDEDGQRFAVLAPGAADPLPRGGERAGIADEDADVEAADVDPGLERRGADDPFELAGEEAAFDLAPFLRQVAGTVAGDARREVRPRLAQPLVHQLRHAARLGEGDRLAPRVHRAGEHVHRDGVRADRVRREEEGVARRARRAALPHHLARLAEERLGEGARLADRRRAGDDQRVAAVEPREAEEAPQHVVRVGAEDPAVDVGLVHRDELQMLEERPPRLVRRQDAEVQHVRVGDDDRGRVVADPPPRRLRRVAVVDLRRLGRLEAERREGAADRGELVAGQCLERIDEDGAGGRVERAAGEEGEHVGERLARGGRRGEKDVVPRGDEVQRRGLMAVEARRAELQRRLARARRPAGGRLGVDRIASRDEAAVAHERGELRIGGERRDERAHVPRRRGFRRAPSARALPSRRHAPLPFRTASRGHSSVPAAI